jgi:ABC-2 type transport system permease protein
MRVWRALRAYVSASMATMFQYRGEMVLWALWGVVYPAVALAMWRAAIAGSPNGRSIRGFEAGDFAAYFLLTMIVGHVSTAWDVFEMGYLVRTGRMSPKLLRPILPLWESLADNLSYKTVTLIILVPIWVGVAIATRPHFATTGVDLAMGLPALLLGAAVHYIWNYNVGLLAFWVTQMNALSESWWGANLFLGGRLAPLQTLPGPLQWVAGVLPFKWIIWFPAAALMGMLTPGEMAVGLAALVGGLVAGIVAFRWLWRAGVRQYSAVGA